MSILKLSKSWSVVILLVASFAGVSDAVADSVYFASNATNGNGSSHAFWIPGDAAPGTYYHWVPSSTPTLTFNGAGWDSSTTAVLTGQIVQTDGHNPVAGGTVFDVKMHMVGGHSYADWTTTMGNDIKNENSTPQSSVNGWKFFTLDPNAVNKLTVVSGSGSDINLDLFSPPSKTLGIQIGLGASMKHPNSVLGASSWLDTHGDEEHGDMNIELTAVPSQTQIVPTPTAALGTLAMLGFMGLRRRRNI